MARPRRRGDAKSVPVAGPPGVLSADRSGPPRSLSSQLTVFLITVGDRANFEDCMAHLRRQDVSFRLDVIHRVAPMEAAFQQMLDRCRTPWFVQADEDMLLEPWALGALYDDAQRSPPSTAIIARPLWDEHLGMSILGVKIYRHGIVRRYPYRRSFSCEMDQVERLVRDGYGVSVSPASSPRDQCVGRHGVHYDARSIFDRYRNLVLRLRRFRWLDWVGELPARFMQRYEREPHELNRWAFLGAVAGLVAPLPETARGDKDYRQYQREPAWRRLSGMLTTGPRELHLYPTSRRGGAGHVAPAALSMLLERYPTIERVHLRGPADPLRHPQLSALLRALQSFGVKTQLETDGLLLARHASDIARWGLAGVRILPGGWSPHPAEPRPTFDVEHLRRIRLAARRVSRAAKGLPLTLTVVLSRRNVREVEGLFDLAAEIGATIELRNTLPVSGDTRRFRRSVLSRDSAADRAAVDRLRAHRHADLVSTWPVLIGPAQDNPRWCRSPWEALSMDARGSVSGCRLVAGPHAQNGSAWAGGPLGVWHNPHFVSLRLQIMGDPQRRGMSTPRASDPPTPEQCARCYGNWQDDSS